MKNITKYFRFLSALMAVVVAVSCSEKDPKPEPEKPTTENLTKFKVKNVPGYYQINTALFAKDDTQHQVYYTEDYSKYEIFNLDESSSLKCTLSAKPSKIGDVVDVTVSGNSLDAYSGKMELVRDELQKLWLWDAATNKGLILMVY